MDLASLLPFLSLLRDHVTANSQLKLQVRNEGLTIPLPSQAKRPKITWIDRWLDVVTPASTSTKGFPAPAPPAPTLTNATSLDALQPTQERTTLTPQALDPPSQRLAAQAISPEASIEYVSKLSPTTPIDLPKLAFYLPDHPDRPSVDAVLTGLSQGFKIGFQGPWVSKEYPNPISARQNPHIISTNLLKQLQLSHTAGPFVSPPFPDFQVYLIGVVPKKHSTEWRTIFHLSFPKHQTTSINSHTSPTDYSLLYIIIDTAISVI